ncbi:hypothetical protein K438DRAFT_1761177 [Mycena galopus ATCC 62051]|nr:hypothetical protein K438DRAFT_1761177 [Mycena galopus ATCC 62051]
MALGHARRSYITGGATVPRGEAACVNKDPHEGGAREPTSREAGPPEVGHGGRWKLGSRCGRWARDVEGRTLALEGSRWRRRVLGVRRRRRGKPLEMTPASFDSKWRAFKVPASAASTETHTGPPTEHTQCSPMRRGQRGEPVEGSGLSRVGSGQCVDFNDGTNPHDTPGVIWIQLHSDQLAANDGGVPRSWILDITLLWRGRSGLPRPLIDAHTGPLTGGYGAPLGHVGGRGTVRERTMIQMRNARADNDENKCGLPRPPIDAHTGPLTEGHGTPLGHVGGRGVASNTAEVQRLAGRSGRDTMIQLRNARADNNENECRQVPKSGLSTHWCTHWASNGTDRSGLPCPPIDAHTGPLTGGHGTPLGHVGGRGVASNTAEVLRLAGRSGRDTMIQTRSARADNDENKCGLPRLPIDAHTGPLTGGHGAPLGHGVLKKCHVECDGT